jgi:GAF domain-containing protein
VTGDVAALPDSVRLESDTLYGVVGVIASSPDLDRVLDGVVEVLTKATRCHACFVYLRRGERLRMRAASRVYANVVGKVEFGLDEGLTGWVARNSRPAFIRENAMDDPRTNFVPELEEERFQSMVAVPIRSRSGTVMGVIVLHTIAPREFDEGTLNLLTHAAPLLAGVIENAQLYQDARRRVATLSTLSALSQRIAAVDGREDLYREATAGVRSLLRSDEVRLYAVDSDLRLLELVAVDPPAPIDRPERSASANAVLLELIQQRDRRDRASIKRVREALELDDSAADVRVAPLAAGGEHLGVLVSASARPAPDDAEELLRAAANQTAVALKKAELIERLTEENIVRDLFTVFEVGDAAEAEARARRARFDLDRPHVFVQIAHASPSSPDDGWAAIAERVEASLRRRLAGALCDVGADQIRALVPLAGAAEREQQALVDTLQQLAVAEGVAIGHSDVRAGAEEARIGLRQAAAACRVTSALTAGASVLAYGDLGAYRYLVHLAADETSNDPYLDAVRTIAAYDKRRGGQLVATLEQYLAERRSATEAARALMVHPNTLRQRLERIETLTGLELASADLLALELAVKLARLNPADA